MQELRIAGPAGTLAGTHGFGGGVPVLLVHGNAGTRNQWAQEQARLTAAGRTSFAFDLRGLGESESRDSATFGYAACADDLEVIVGAIGEPVVLVGHSFGGAVVAEFTRRHPERVATLLFVDAPGRIDLPEDTIRAFRAGFEPEAWPSFRETWFAPMLIHATAATRRQVMAELASSAANVVRDNACSLFGNDPGLVFERYHGATLALSAADLERPYALTARHPEIETIRVPRVSHWLHLDAPNVLAAAIDRLL